MAEEHDERRASKRRKFGYYMRIMDTKAQAHLGYLADISLKGFKLDCSHQIPAHIDFTLRLDLTREISDKPYIGFVARSIWCRPDPMDPNSMIAGFEITNISLSDAETYKKIVEKYGTSELHW